ncbi:MAG: GHKL domain-containing protein [Bacteroidales bacterium]|nr:GHKL domain-containing protein [Bacteroidales bacterium]
MIIKNLSSKPLLKDFLLMILFGVLSFLFGLIKLSVPGIEGTVSDLSEIPLLISVFHLSNPLFAIGISAISSIGTPAGGSFFSTLIMHSISLMVYWGIFNYLKKKNLSTPILGLINFFSSLVYYLVFLIPLLIITQNLVGLNVETKFVAFYFELVHASQFEIITSSLVASLYLIQNILQLDLKKHMFELEDTVKERTTDLNSTIKKLKNTQQYLIQKEKMSSLGTLSAGIAHEINNPLNFISGGSYIISEIKDELSINKSSDVIEKYEYASGMIEDGITRANSIVKTLMNFTQVRSSKLIESDLHEIIENTMLFLNFKIPENILIKKDFQLKKNIPLYIDKIHQVIINILENAIFELKSNSKENKLITISTRQKEDSAVLIISNNATQIPEQNLTQIFDPFFTTKDPGQGIGLGLSISYSLITEHKGKIYAENFDEGVNLIIELPLV